MVHGAKLAWASQMGYVGAFEGPGMKSGLGTIYLYFLDLA